MPLKTTVPSLDEVHESLHEDYEQDDGGTYTLKLVRGMMTADQLETHEAGLKSALEQERTRNRELREQRNALEGKFSQVDIDKYNEMVAAEKKRAEDEATAAGQWDTLRAQMVESHTSELEKERSETTRVRDALAKRLVDGDAAMACNELEGNATLLLPHIKASCDMIIDDAGEYTVRVKDQAGNHRINGEGNFVTVKDLVAEMKQQDTFLGAFKGTNQTGGGTPPDGGAGDTPGLGGGTPPAPNGSGAGPMTDAEKIAFMNEHGAKAYIDTLRR